MASNLKPSYLKFNPLNVLYTDINILPRFSPDYSQSYQTLVGTGYTGTTIQQGYASSMMSDGTILAVGAPGDNSQIGGAWAFVKNAGVWSQQGSKIVGGGETGQAEFGTSISVDTNTMAIGGPGDNIGIGAAWAFNVSGSTWSQVGTKLVGTGGTGTPTQGNSVGYRTDTIISGGSSDNSGVGAGWIFFRSAGTFTQQGAKLVGTGNTGASSQGYSSAISVESNTIVLGGPGDNTNVGASWVFNRSGGVWSQTGAKLVGTGGTGSTISQGKAVAISSGANGGTLVIGASDDNTGVGAVWVFTNTAGTWSQQGAKLVGTGGTGQTFQGFGVAISADGNTIVVGGPEDNNGAGATWLFTRNAGVWTQLGSKMSITTSAIGQGISVAIDATADNIVFGASNGPIGEVLALKKQYADTLEVTSNLKIDGYGITSKITGLDTPIGPTDAANKSYVDSAASSGTPAGTDRQVQFNNAGSFGASSNLVFDTTSLRVGYGTPSVSPVTGSLVLSGGLGIGADTFSNGVFNTSSTVASVSTITGSVVTLGGVGISGDCFIGGQVNIVNSTTSTSATSGALIVTGGAGIGGSVFVGGILSGSATPSTSPSSGSFQIPGGGGIGVSGDAWIGGTLYGSNVQSNDSVTGAIVVQGGVAIGQQLHMGGIIYLADVASGSYLSGGLIGTGTSGIGVGGNIYAGGQIVGSSLPASSSTSGGITSQGGISAVGRAWIGGQIVADSGIGTTSTTTGALLVTGSGGAAIGGDVQVGGTVFGSNVQSNSTIGGAFVTTGLGGIGCGGSINLGQTLFCSATASTNTSTGAIVVPSGGDIRVGGIIYGGSTSSTSTTTGAVIVAGGVAVGENLHVGGTVYTSSTASTSPTTGSLIVAGGEGIGGSLYVGGVINGSNTPSTSITTGSYVSLGGIGVSGDIYAMSFKTPSDINMKKDIVSLTNSLSLLGKIGCYNYRFKDHDNGLQYGVIAQELESIGLGDIVSSSDTHKSVNYLALIPLIINAIKELHNMIDSGKIDF